MKSAVGIKSHDCHPPGTFATGIEQDTAVDLYDAGKDKMNRSVKLPLFLKAMPRVPTRTSKDTEETVEGASNLCGVKVKIQNHDAAAKSEASIALKPDVVGVRAAHSRARTECIHELEDGELVIGSELALQATPLHT